MFELKPTRVIGGVQYFRVANLGFEGTYNQCMRYLEIYAQKVAKDSNKPKKSSQPAVVSKRKKLAMRHFAGLIDN